jgi:hypothetical protein
MDGMKSFFISFLIYGGGIIFLGFKAGYPIVGILLALFIVASLYVLSIASIVHGAKMALQNPPPPGKTKVTMKVFGTEVDMSDEFYFSPSTMDDRPRNFTIYPLGGRPLGIIKGGVNINLPDVKQWHLEAKRILEEEGHKEFKKYCMEHGENESTVRSRIKKYFS